MPHTVWCTDQNSQKTFLPHFWKLILQRSNSKNSWPWGSRYYTISQRERERESQDEAGGRVRKKKDDCQTEGGRARERGCTWQLLMDNPATYLAKTELRAVLPLSDCQYDFKTWGRGKFRKDVQIWSMQKPICSSTAKHQVHSHSLTMHSLWIPIYGILHVVGGSHINSHKTFYFLMPEGS